MIGEKRMESFHWEAVTPRVNETLLEKCLHGPRYQYDGKGPSRNRNGLQGSIIIQTVVHAWQSAVALHSATKSSLESRGRKL